MHVQIYKLVNDEDHLARVLRLQEGKIVAEPESKLLRGILAEPIHDLREDKVYDAERTPEEFLRALHQRYSSVCLRASKVLGGE